MDPWFLTADVAPIQSCAGVPVAFQQGLHGSQRKAGERCHPRLFFVVHDVREPNGPCQESTHPWKKKGSVRVKMRISGNKRPRHEPPQGYSLTLDQLFCCGLLHQEELSLPRERQGLPKKARKKGGEGLHTFPGPNTTKQKDALPGQQALFPHLEPQAIRTLARQS